MEDKSCDTRIAQILKSDLFIFFFHRLSETRLQVSKSDILRI